MMAGGRFYFFSYCIALELETMNTRLSPADLSDSDEYDPTELHVSRGPGRVEKHKKIKRSETALTDEKIAYAGEAAVADEQAFTPTFTSSRHEREWILTYLGGFFNEQVISDVLSRVKGGKEANVYCCQAFPGLGVELLAAKIYRPRMLRNLRNDALYREGRKVIDEAGKEVRNDRQLHAISKGTTFGKELSHLSWLGHEYQALELLHKAGADVPRPYASGPNTILMEYLGEVYNPAPTLNRVYLPSRAEARRVYQRLLHNVEIMLSCGRVHGDLSAYNVLYWEGEFRIIDFPQAIDPHDNRSAFPIFRRDLVRLCEYFERYGIHSHPDALARQLWQKYGLGRIWDADYTDWEDTGKLK